MNTKILALTLGCFWIMPFAASAQPFNSINELVVVSLGGGSFEVVKTRRTGARGYWCAAADYTRRALGNPKRGRIFLTVPEGPSRTTAGKPGASFTTNPDAGMASRGQSYSAAIDKAGTNLLVATAYKYCSDINPKNQGGDG